MTNLIGGLATLIIHIGITFITPKISTIVDVDTPPMWYSITLGVIAVLYLYFGYQMSKKENRHFTGTVFCILALCTGFLIVMMNASY